MKHCSHDYQQIRGTNLAKLSENWLRSCDLSESEVNMGLFFANLFGFLVLHKRIVLYCVLGLVVIGGVLFGIDKCSNWQTSRETNKIKANIANGITKIANIQTQISNLEVQKAETQGELKRDVETYANQTYGREDDKIRTNQALANYNTVLKTNTNVNATAEDLIKALDKLDQQ